MSDHPLWALVGLWLLALSMAFSLGVLSYLCYWLFDTGWELFQW